MKISASRWVLGAGALLVTGCAALSGGGSLDGSVQRNVGVASHYDLAEKASRVIQLNQFEVEREEYDGIFYIETRWRDRAPFDDEQANGVEAAQSRMIVRGSPRAPDPDGQLYNVTVIVQNRVSVVGESGWRRDLTTSRFNEYARQITEDLRDELEIGVRRFGPDGGPPPGGN